MSYGPHCMANTPKKPLLFLPALLLILSPPAIPQVALETSVPAPTQIPDLAWSPIPFKPIFQEPVRYIDYRNGKDSNPGTRDQPWKHHPWDANAKDRAAASRDAVTYVFKRGVVYRGQMKARESGTEQK